jgi:membrane associated rhomboid family serine protease
MTEQGATGGPPADAVPTCYRHPGRETYIRCARCDRPICPDCMVGAAVGFQCPECVAEGQAGHRQATTVFGGAVRARDSLATMTLVGLCVVVYALQVAIPTFTAQFWNLGLAVADGEYYRLVTSGFLHGGLFHILFNMWALWVFGQPLERLLGRTRFVALYLTCLVAGSTASYLFNNPLSPSVGASGAIFGLVGAMLVVGRRMRFDLSWVVGFVVLNVLILFVVSDIDWRAHLGGAVAGLVVGFAMAYAPRAHRVWLAAVTVVVVIGLCAALVSVRTQQIRTDPLFAPAFEQGLIQIPLVDYRPFP